MSTEAHRAPVPPHPPTPERRTFSEPSRAGGRSPEAAPGAEPFLAGGRSPEPGFRASEPRTFSGAQGAEPHTRWGAGAQPRAGSGGAAPGGVEGAEPLEDGKGRGGGGENHPGHLHGPAHPPHGPARPYVPGPNTGDSGPGRHPHRPAPGTPGTPGASGTPGTRTSSRIPGAPSTSGTAAPDTPHPGTHPRRTPADAPPPPAATSRFPDAPPRPSAPPRPRPQHPHPQTPPTRPIPPAPPAPPRTDAPRPDGGIVETTGPLPPPPPPRPAPTRPHVTFGEPDTRPVHDAPVAFADRTRRPHPLGDRIRTRAAAAAACLVLGVGLLGGAVTGSWLTGGGSDGDGARTAYAAAGDLWHSLPVDRLFPPTVDGDGAGPGGSDRTWTRIAVAPDTTCRDAFDPLLGKALAPAGCLRLLRATYTDATRSHVTTVGLLFTRADATAMTALKTRFAQQGLDRRTDLMPRPYAAKDTVAAGFGDAQRASWTVSVLTDAPVVVYAVSGFADGRTVTDPQPAAKAMASGATTAPAQAGLGHEARGLADRVERRLRTAVASATEKPS